MLNKLYMYADVKTINILKDETSKVILLGSYLGYSNFGDILQLKGAIKFHREHTNLEPVVVCALQSISDDTFINKIRKWFGIKAIIFIDEEAYDVSLLHLQPIREARTIEYFHLYGGGFLNVMWGDYYISFIEGLINSFKINNYIVTGQQIDSKYVSSLQAHFQRFPPRIVGGRDYNSVDIINKMGIPVDFSFDDAIEIISTWVTRRPINKIKTKTGNILIHINTSSYTEAHNNIVIDNLNAVINKYPYHEAVLLQVYDDCRLDVRDTLFSVVNMEDKFPFLNYKVVDLAKMALQVDPYDTVDDANLMFLDGELAVSSSYHTTIFCNLLGIPCYLISLNDYYQQKRHGLGEEGVLEDFLNKPYLQFYDEKISMRKKWLEQLPIYFLKINSSNLSSVKFDFPDKTKPFHVKDNGLKSIIENNLAWQKDQTNIWWEKAEELKNDLSWQKEQTDIWWEKAEELKNDLSWQKEQTDIWWEETNQLKNIIKDMEKIGNYMLYKYRSLRRRP